MKVYSGFCRTTIVTMLIAMLLPQGIGTPAQSAHADGEVANRAMRQLLISDIDTIMSDALLVEHLASGATVDVAGIVADTDYGATNQYGYAVWEKPLGGFRGAGGVMPTLGVTITYAIAPSGDFYVGSVGPPSEALAVLVGYGEWLAKDLSLRDIRLYGLLMGEYNRLETDGYVSGGDGLNGPIDIQNNYGETIHVMYSAVIMFATYNGEWQFADRLDVWDPSGPGETTYTGDTWRKLDLSCSGNTHTFVYSHVYNDNSNSTYVKHDDVTVASRGTSIGFDDHARFDSCPASIELGGNRSWSELDSSVHIAVVGGSISSSNHAEYPANGGNPSPSVLTIPPTGGPDTTPPAAITDLSATPGTYPGDIVLSWTAPGDDGESGTASLYAVKYDTVPISSENDWNYAFDVEGEPTPLVASSTQTMTVSLIPGHTYHFAIKAQDEVPNTSDLSNPASTQTPGKLISSINWYLENDPSSILDQQVTVLVMPVRTDDWTLGVGDYSAVVEIVQFLRHFREAILVKGGLGSFVIAVKAVLGHMILDNWFQMRAQLVWGLHESEYSGDPTLLVWDPSPPLMNHGVPYVVTGIVRKKTFFDILALREDYFYYLEVEDSHDLEIQLPSTTHPHFTIPADYTYHNWEDIHLDGVTNYGDQICTIGMVTERYPLDGYHYVRIQLMERVSGALVVRVSTSEAAPDMGAMALYCGTKRAAGGDDLHPGWLPIAKYLDTITGQGSVEILQGTSSTVVRHERSPMTFLGIEIGCPADIHVYDPGGNHVGVVYDGSGNVIGVENEIPDVEYFYGVDDAPEFMGIGNPTTGVYTITIHGTDTGTYTQTIRIYDSSGGQTYTSTVVAHPTSAGQEDTTVVDEIPAAPTGLEVDVDNNTVNLDWDDNTESDLGGYNVYRSTQANGVYQKMNDSSLSASSFTDTSADEYTAYYYYVTAEDTDHNESGHLTPVVSRYLIYLPLALRNH